MAEPTVNEWLADGYEYGDHPYQAEFPGWEKPGQNNSRYDVQALKGGGINETP